MFRQLERQLLFPGTADRGDPALFGRLVGAEQLWLGRDDSMAECWFFPVAGGPAPLVLFSHGNGELIDHWARPFVRLRARGFNVALVEFRGYGRSRGVPEEAGLVGDFAEAAAELSKRETVDESRLVYFGRSLGGGVACGAARLLPPAALVLASTFTSVPALAKTLMGIPAFAITQKFDNLEAIERYQGPVLISHGTRDEIVPFAHARALESAASNAVLSSQVCGHNDWPSHWDEWLDELTGWLSDVIG